MKKTIDNFIKTKATRNLSEDEKNFIIKSYFEVRKHEDSYVQVLYQVGQQLDSLLVRNKFEMLQDFPVDFLQMPKKEFLQCLDEFVKKAKNDKPSAEPEFEHH